MSRTNTTRVGSNHISRTGACEKDAVDKLAKEVGPSDFPTDNRVDQSNQDNGTGTGAKIGANQGDEGMRYLLTSHSCSVKSHLDRVKRHFNADDSRGRSTFPSPEPNYEGVVEGPSTIDTLCALFNLSDFERDILVTCIGVEIDPEFRRDVAALVNGASSPSLDILLTRLPGADWAAITPGASLRYWHLIEIDQIAGAAGPLTSCPIKVDERILHFATGDTTVDKRLCGVLSQCGQAEAASPAQREVALQLAEAWQRPRGRQPDRKPIPINIHGDDESTSAVVAVTTGVLGLRALSVEAEDIPANVESRELLIRLCGREAILLGAALVVNVRDEVQHDRQFADSHSATQFIQRYVGAAFIASRAPLGATPYPLLRVEAPSPTLSDRVAQWQAAIGFSAEEINSRLARIASHFGLTARDISAVALATASSECAASMTDEDLEEALWTACRMQARGSLDHLAQRVISGASWGDIILPESQMGTLREIAASVKNGAKVGVDWGFSANGTRGMGIAALFSGPSGTGKTLAAEVVANELRLDLYRIDLSKIVNKYIGETEKNLGRIFDSAESSGAVLLFDEADALFGKRSEVKDSHDRYANIEVSYLLQRMESYRGLAILTTNLAGSLDTAFLRRLRFAVKFPFPDAEHRALIWQCAFPANAPTEGLDFRKLSRLSVSGGNIRCIALRAAFLAADANTPIRMIHCLLAARGEYAKLDKPLTESEIGGWV